MLGGHDDGHGGTTYGVWHNGAWRDLPEQNVVATNAAGHVLYLTPDDRCPGRHLPLLDTGSGSPLDLSPLWDVQTMNASDHVIGSFPDASCTCSHMRRHLAERGRYTARKDPGGSTVRPSRSATTTRVVGTVTPGDKPSAPSPGARAR